MIKSVIAAALVVAAVAPARAGDAVPVSMKVSLQNAVGIVQALSSLDSGYDKQDAGKTVHASFELSPEVRVHIAWDIRVLSQAVSDFRVARQSVQVTIPGADKKDSPEERKFNAETDGIAAVRESFSLYRVTIDDLDLATNPIPVRALALITMLSQGGKP